LNRFNVKRKPVIIYLKRANLLVKSIIVNNANVVWKGSAGK